jgi:chloride channel protein, CIC family
MTAKNFASGCSAPAQNERTRPKFLRRRAREKSNLYQNRDLSAWNAELSGPASGVDILREEALQPNVTLSGARLSWRFFVLVLPVGFGAGAAAGLLMWLLRAAQHFFWSYRSGEFLTAVEHASAGERLGILLLAGLVAGVARWLMTLQPGEQKADLSEAIWFRYGHLPFLQAIERAVLSIVIVGMGASLGREAAPKMTAAAIANVLSSWGKLSEAERRILVACGAGAGMGAVYNVPFAGALFSLEVLLGTLALPLALPALTTSVIATAVAWLFIPNQPTYQIPNYDVSPSLILWAAAAGPLAGLAATFYVRAIAWADSRKPQGWRLLLLPVIVLTALGALALPFPQLLGNGKDAVLRAFLGEYGPSLLVAIFFLKPLATVACLSSGAPGGLFTPTLTCGAMLGAALGFLWALFWPQGAAGSYAAVGAGAFLAAAMQSPVAAVVFMLELAPGTIKLTVPIILAVAGAVFVAGRFETRSIYSGRVHRIGPIAQRQTS